jgi:hypothetical protein
VNTLLDAKLVYTEPLGNGSFLAADYGATINNSHSNQNSYNKSPVGKYSDLDSLYSNDYQYDIFTQKGGLAYNLVKKKLRFNAGNDIGFASYDQHDLHADTSVQRSFINWYPHASAGYNFTSQKRLNLSYYGNTSQPTLQQLQPILTNEDPLNITIGNPGLKPQFVNRFSAYYNEYKILTERGIYADVSYTVTQNAIGNSVNLDTTGKRTTQYVNVNGNYTFQGYFSYGFKWKKPDLGIEFNSSINQNRNLSIVNDQPNATKSGSYAL